MLNWTFKVIFSSYFTPFSCFDDNLFSFLLIKRSGMLGCWMSFVRFRKIFEKKNYFSNAKLIKLTFQHYIWWESNPWGYHKISCQITLLNITFEVISNFFNKWFDTQYLQILPYLYSFNSSQPLLHPFSTQEKRKKNPISSSIFISTCRWVSGRIIID